MKNRLLKLPAAFAVAAVLSSETFAQTFTPAQLAQDLDYFNDSLPVKHKNLFANITKQQFNTAVAGLRAKLDYLDYSQFVTELFKITALIGDEHTNVLFEEPAVFPITFDAFSNAIAVSNCPPAFGYLLHAKLVKIDQTPVTDIVQLFKPIIKNDNSSFFETALLQHLVNPIILKGLGITSSTTAADFYFATADSGTVKITLQALVPKRSVQPANNTAKKTGEDFNYKFVYDSLHHAVYFNYRRCRDDAANPFSVFNDSLFACIKKFHPNKLILDLRENGGGNSAILNPFLDSLRNSYLNNKKRLFVLIGKKTFSSALMNAVTLKRNYKTTFIGQMTAGSINHYGEVRGMYLPNTKLLIGYSTQYWETWKGHNGPLYPDITVNPTLEEFLANKDAALEMIYKR